MCIYLLSTCTYCDYQSTDVFYGVNGNEWMNVLLWLPIYWRFLWGKWYWMNECLTVTTILLTFSLGWMVLIEWMSYGDYQSTDVFSGVNGTEWMNVLLWLPITDVFSGVNVLNEWMSYSDQSLTFSLGLMVMNEWMSYCDYQSTDVFSGVNGTDWMNVLLWLPIYWCFLGGEWYWMNECLTVTTILLTFSLGWMVLIEWMSYCDYQSTDVFSGVNGTEWMNVLLWLPIYWHFLWGEWYWLNECLTMTTNLLTISLGEWYWMNECLTVTTNLLTFYLVWMVLNKWMCNNTPAQQLHPSQRYLHERLNQK